MILKSEIKNFFSFVHNLPIEEKATPNTKVIRLISSIKGRKFIFSNAYRPYIERILAKLELEGEFEDIWDIYRLKLHCKPNHTSFELFKSEYAINYSEMVLIDDSKTNLKSAQALGIHSYHPNVLTT